MIWSVFSFYNELDILEVKLAEQDPVVDRFRIIESTRTHSGHHKPLYYQENAYRFQQWHDKIDHVVHEADPGPDDWRRERSQRNLGISCDSFNPADLVIVSDLDEIVSAETIRSWDGSTVSFLLPMHVYRVNWRWDLEPLATWQIAGGSRARDLLSDGTQFRQEAIPTIPDAGWHLTCMGGPEMIRNKLRRYAHRSATAELADTDAPDLAWETGKDVFGRDIPIVVTDQLPKYLLDHRDKFAHLWGAK